MSSPAVIRIARIGLTVADLESARAFYEDALGFRHVVSETRGGRAFAELTGLAGASARACVLGLGGQEIELVGFDAPGRAYPAARAANDPWLQHFAIVVADMPQAYARLMRHAHAPISIGGPQQLPPHTGSVTAYKFRDPEGHPLELSHIPTGFWADPAHAPAAGAVFLGVDHCAIAVVDLDASVAFYTGTLGMRVGARGLNSGPTQDRLDGLTGTRVDIVTLEPAGASGPHIELLAYRSPLSRRAAVEMRPNDIAATRLLMVVNDLAAVAGRLRSAGARLVSNGLVEDDDGATKLIVRDPDGHLLELVQR